MMAPIHLFIKQLRISAGYEKTSQSNTAGGAQNCHKPSLAGEKGGRLSPFVLQPTVVRSLSTNPPLSQDTSSAHHSTFHKLPSLRQRPADPSNGSSGIRRHPPSLPRPAEATAPARAGRKHCVCHGMSALDGNMQPVSAQTPTKGQGPLDANLEPTPALDVFHARPIGCVSVCKQSLLARH